MQFGAALQSTLQDWIRWAFSDSWTSIVNSHGYSELVVDQLVVRTWLHAESEVVRAFHLSISFAEIDDELLGFFRVCQEG